ncbi:type I CRISPR-associated protein Cas8a1/Csx8 [Hominibacterium faecale]|uniref:type I CRISPR-associated protein Cas8a1/Csx8 n=1 Tax=Hominibacterium faecale TaxID=2839743 RepID=UPI0022B29F25
MKIKLENQKYDTALFPTEWRYSAAIVGLVRYFKQQGIDFEMDYTYDGWKGIAYKQEDLTEERLIDFAEAYYGQAFPHRKAESLLNMEEWTEEQIKLVNENLKGNTILKKTVKTKFDSTNQEELLDILQKNRAVIIRDSFKNKKNMYAKFANTNLFLTEGNPHCRLQGYTIDEGRKTKSLSFNFEENAFQGTDMQEFDWIPFAFTDTYESFFINNNGSVKSLCHTANQLQEIMEKSKEEKEGARTILLKSMAKAQDFIDFDVEVISKSQDHEYFESLFIRKQALDALRKISDLSLLRFRTDLAPDYWLDVQKEVVDCCINQVSLDSLIEILLKVKEKKGIGYLNVVISLLIELNLEWGEEMEKENKRKNIYIAKGCAEKTVKKLRSEKKENKLDSYRKKLISAIVFHDYDRVNEIILQLSAYAEISYPFAYSLFEDGEGNKEVAFAFANGLDSNSEEKKQEGK